jgi:hypothetical protein
MRVLPCLLVLTLLLAAGCTGTPLRVPTAELQANEVVLGPAHGKATGIMLFQFIPIGQNDRFADAYSRALVSMPGATRLVDITIHENWFWAWILNGYSFHLEGTAVRSR